MNIMFKHKDVNQFTWNQETLGQRSMIEPWVRDVFNSHLRETISQILGEDGEMDSEWAVFLASIIDVAVRRCGHNLCSSFGGGYTQIR